MVSRLWQDHLKHEEITANFKLNFAHHRRSFDQIREEVAKAGKNGYVPSFAGHIIALDELGIGADSYDFFTKDTRQITELVLEIRKLGCIVYYTVQRFGLIARRLRDQTDGFVLMRDLDKGKMTYPDGSPAKRHRDVCDGLAQYQFVDSYQEPIGRPKLFDGKPWYEYYDTDEFIHNKD